MFHSRRINKVEDFLVCYIRKRTTKIVLDYSLVDADYKNKSKNKMVFFVSFLRKNKQSLTELCGIVCTNPNYILFFRLCHKKNKLSKFTHIYS